ncbi:hypothetical protein HYQ46_005571 [Verticillium longisporum]|nr:hypothetical protein HYQ46_005571 [Verticillium longisporum]
MAGARVDPKCGTREEDWFDPDADSDADDYAENMERAEAAAQACMERFLQQHQEQCSSHAETANDAVQEALALAQPDSLTTEDVHELFSGHRQTCTPVEVYAKAKEAIDRGHFETLTSAAEVQLLTNGFHEKIDVTQAAARRQFPPRPLASAVELRSAMQIFINDTNIRGYNAGLRWSALPEAEKETYRTRSEAVRRGVRNASNYHGPWIILRREECGNEFSRVS